VPTVVPDGRTKIAVLGGGAGGIAAAFELTATPELRERFEVTVYQLGWRLGGKGASGRNAAAGNRIEEHGLHIWFGFYDNAGLLRTITAQGAVDEITERAIAALTSVSTGARADV